MSAHRIEQLLAFGPGFQRQCVAIEDELRGSGVAVYIKAGSSRIRPSANFAMWNPSGSLSVPISALSGSSGLG
jgi:hypothetical protein